MPARAQTATPDSSVQAVVNTAERFFQAMAARDTTALLSVTHPDAVLIAVGTNGRAGVGTGSIREWIRDVARSPEPWRERFTETPHVEVNGPLATVWSRYDFHIGEQFSHCGTDAFQLVRDGDAWRLLVVTFTVEMVGCGETAVP
jgi:ketosteroid isomerase-like protein